MQRRSALEHSYMACTDRQFLPNAPHQLLLLLLHLERPGDPPEATEALRSAINSDMSMDSCSPKLRQALRRRLARGKVLQCSLKDMGQVVNSKYQLHCQPLAGKCGSMLCTYRVQASDHRGQVVDTMMPGRS